MRSTESGTPGRLPAAAVRGIKRIRFLPQDSQASLVNISTTGLLAESSTRLRVSSVVQAVFEGGFLPASTTGRVLRCEVAAMGRDGQLWYHIAIEFDEPIPLDQNEPAPEPAVAPASAEFRNRW